MQIMWDYKKKLRSAIPASIAAFTVISVLSYISLNTSHGYILAVSFGASMVLLFGFPSSNFTQPKNIFFGHVLTSISGLIFTYISLPLFIALAASVAIGIFLMIMLDLVHPPAGGNPIAIILGEYTYDFLFTTIILGTIIIIFLGIVINNFILKIKYPN